MPGGRFSGMGQACSCFMPGFALNVTSAIMPRCSVSLACKEYFSAPDLTGVSFQSARFMRCILPPAASAKLGGIIYLATSAAEVYGIAAGFPGPRNRAPAYRYLFLSRAPTPVPPRPYLSITRGPFTQSGLPHRHRLLIRTRSLRVAQGSSHAYSASPTAFPTA